MHEPPFANKGSLFAEQRKNSAKNIKEVNPMEETWKETWWAKQNAIDGTKEIMLKDYLNRDL